MSILESIKSRFFPKKPIETLVDTPFIFPYSADKEQKKQQIWDNLQKGILFEDTGVFIPWSTPFRVIAQHAEQTRATGDRTNWFLGKRLILDGYSCAAEVMKWITIKSSEPFRQIDEFLGYNFEGNQKFMMLKDRFTDLLGEPESIDLEKFGEFDLGVILWMKGEVTITLVGIEQFECKYRLHVGLNRE